MAATNGRALRPARPGAGGHPFEVTRLSVAGLVRSHYPAVRIESWMGTRAGLL